MNTNNAGGGEILDYMGSGGTSQNSQLDSSVLRQFAMLPWVRTAIVILLIVIALLIIMKILAVKNPLRGRALSHELNHLDKVKKHDESIIRANKTLNLLTKIIERTPLAMDKSSIEYWQYNLSRANVRVPGGMRVIKPIEFNAVVKTVGVLVAIVALIITLLINAPAGVMLFIMDVVFASTLPMMMIRNIVKQKDMEIVENFANFYLMLHYVLLASAGTPIIDILKSYDKTTESEEMHRFIDVCVHYIDTYGEYNATRYIAKQYREISQVGKLMRLIRQANEGGDIRAELIGFRNELLQAKVYAMEQRRDKLIARARASFNILMPILVQAIASAAAIYMDDLSIAGSIF